ncbi:MAG TPA: glucoamylase family protein [Elusimicrobiota bacterium]|nr:glucoamylase family protein [Elusimicrobiota bacterium]
MKKVFALLLSASLAACAAPQPSPYRLSADDERFLDELERPAFNFFWEQTGPETGLTQDRAPNFEKKDRGGAASIAASGFALTALGVGVSRGWVPREAAYARALATLKHFRYRQPQVHGWFYHFVDPKTGARVWDSELSSIDTALFLLGALFIGEYFPGTEVQRLAQEIYARVDFGWMLTDGGAKPGSLTLSMGWNPEHGFLASRWDSYCELMALYLLGLGSPAHPLPTASWSAWKRPRGAYAGGAEHVMIAPLFTHQYSHVWFDFRGKRDAFADYFDNSIAATLANRRFAVDQAASYATYGPDVWGLTASDGPDGYKAYGAPPAPHEHDGTVAPTAAGGSLVFTPELSLRALRAMRAKYGDRIWGRYGFCDAFNADPRWAKRFNAPGLWRSPDALAIDEGPILLMAENLRTGLVWETFARSAAARRGMERAGFSAGGP